MMKIMVVLWASLVAGCAANAPLAPECRWLPNHPRAAIDLRDRDELRHLSDDAQVAEDIAIRHADITGGTGSGRRDVPLYRTRRETCKTSLFATIADQHGVSVENVASAVAQRRVWLDALVMIGFAMLYAALARQVAGRIFQGALGDSHALAASMTIVVAVVFAGIGLFAGDVWTGLIESIRLSNGHVSYRADRVPWRQYPVPIFFAGVVVFLAAAISKWKQTRLA
ncbi:MAG TPA: hypothetical protein VFZ38_05725 [Vicinamibacterales bacterium]